MAATRNITIYQGDTYAHELRIKDSANAVINITSRIYAGQIRKKRSTETAAATFSDNMVNLKQTFSYLNCALQDQYLNRGEWRLLEEQERKWDDESDLTVKIDLVWDEGFIILPTGGHVPTDMIKHIYFEKTGSWKCFEFENVKPTKGWEEHEAIHNHE